MKIRKKAIQKNFVVNRYYYRDQDYCRLSGYEGVDYLDGTLVVFSSYATDVKVILDEYGYYTTVAVLVTGEQIYIEL